MSIASFLGYGSDAVAEIMIKLRKAERIDLVMRENFLKDKGVGLIQKLILGCLVIPLFGFDWGFFAHKKINTLSVFTLPPEMIGFYKKNISLITELSVAPDQRRYAVEAEGPRHYIDLDRYGDSAMFKLPQYWKEAVAQIGEDSLMANGIVPWRIIQMHQLLKEAFLISDPKAILKLSAELGHYVADAHVPLHTTSNYDGQLTGQTGIHALWESRLPELFYDEYDFFVGKASYVNDVPAKIWATVAAAHLAVDSVLTFESMVSKKAGNKKYSFETRGKRTIKVVAKGFAEEYHAALNGMVERQMRASVKMIGDLWYTAWVDGGQPDLKKLIDYEPTPEELAKRKEELQEWRSKRNKTRIHEADENH